MYAPFIRNAHVHQILASAFMMPRQLTEDALITVSRPKEQSMLLKKGSFIMFELIGMREYCRHHVTV